jgi:hypothetical protein
MTPSSSNYCTNDWWYCKRSGHHANRERWTIRRPTARRINRAIRSCQRWCDRKNAALKKARDIEKLMEGSTT